MKQFGKILRFELKNYLRNKVFVGITVFLVVVVAVVMFFPRLAEGLGGEDKPEEALPVLLVSLPASDTADGFDEACREAFTASFPMYEVKITGESPDAIRERILSGEAECAFVLDSLTSYTYYVDTLSLYDGNTAVADEVMQNLYYVRAMVNGGIPAEAASQILSVQIQHEVNNLGQDQAQNFFYTYLMIFALYMVILLYGQMVATNVATEKSSRAMELLITSAEPSSMMFGKVIASCFAGLIQLVAVFGSMFLCFRLNETYWEGNQVVASIFDMPPALLAYMLLFFVLGFLIYAFLYGAIGSTVSKLEDINTSVMPVTVLFILGFFVVMFSMSSGSVDNTLMMICSYVPFTSPMAMFTRIAMSTVPIYEIVISVAILFGSVVGVGVLSAKIYRVGVLLYGTTPKLGSILKAIRRA